jgi:hypothetical protein
MRKRWSSVLQAYDKGGMQKASANKRNLEKTKEQDGASCHQYMQGSSKERHEKIMNKKSPCSGTLAYSQVCR